MPPRDAAFVAGVALSWNDFYREQCEECEVDNCLGLLLNIVFFAFLGATIPWDGFNAPEYGMTPARLVLLGMSFLLFRRLPAMLALYRYVPAIRDVSEAAFIGYFAPSGAGAFYYMEQIIDEFKDDGDGHAVRRILEVVKPVTYVLILSSILGHTFSIPLVKMYFTYRGIGSIKLEGEDGHSSSSQQSDSDDSDDDQDGSGDISQERGRQTGQGAYRCDGTWDQNASWRHSTGHKLGPHHRIWRNQDGEAFVERRPEREIEAEARRSMRRNRRMGGDLEAEA